MKLFPHIRYQGFHLLTLPAVPKMFSECSDKVGQELISCQRLAVII